MSNTPDNREKERKYRVNGLEYWETPGRLCDVVGERAISHTVDCKTNDWYWKIGAAPQFVRLRDSWGMTPEGFSRQLLEITAKEKDLGNNWNRKEINTGVTRAQDAYKLLEMMAGAPLGKIHKIEWVAWGKDGVIFSVSQVHGTVFLEVEHEDEDVVRRYATLLESRMDLTPEPRSFFELYIEGKKKK